MLHPYFHNIILSSSLDIVIKDTCLFEVLFRFASRRWSLKKSSTICCQVPICINLLLIVLIVFSRDFRLDISHFEPVSSCRERDDESYFLSPSVVDQPFLKKMRRCEVVADFNVPLLEVWIQLHDFTDNKVHGANLGPTCDRQGPSGPHVGPMNLAIWVHCLRSLPHWW